MSAKRVDANQKEIVAALRAVGARVRHTHMVGGGFPDICVKFRWRIYLLEIKDGAKAPSARKLTSAEEKFFGEWAGSNVYVVESVEAALAVIGANEYKTS
jgi:hypothetical protein